MVNDPWVLEKRVHSAGGWSGLRMWIRSYWLRRLLLSSLPSLIFRLTTQNHCCQEMYIWFRSLFFSASFGYSRTLYKSDTQEIHLRSKMAFSEDYGLVSVTTTVSALFSCLSWTHPAKKCKAEKK